MRPGRVSIPARSACDPPLGGGGRFECASATPVERPAADRALGSRSHAAWAAAALVATATLAYLLAWPLALGRADESHLLHGAYRVFAGERLYADVFEIITPLAFYLFALVFALAGPTLLAARVAMSLIEMVGAVAIFRLTVPLAGRVEGVLAVLALVVLSLSVWPYASAHWISTVLALVVATVTVERSRQRTCGRPIVAGLLIGVAICVQQQRGVFLALWLPLAFAVLARAEPRGARIRRWLAATTWAAGVATVVTAAVLGHAAWVASPEEMLEMLFGFAARNYRGTDESFTTWAAIAPLTGPHVAYTWHGLLQIAPVFAVIEGLRLLRRRPWDDVDRARACLVLLAAMMALSVVYLPDAVHVAFVLPFLVLPGLCTLHDLRVRMSQAGGVRRAVAAVAGGALALVLVVRGLANLGRARAESPVRWQSAFGTLDTDESMRALHDAVGRHLVTEPDGKRLLYSFPGDAWLYLALPAAPATRFDIMVPARFPQAYVDEVAAALREGRAGTVVALASWPPGDLGPALASRYDAVEDSGPHRIYVRKAPPAVPPRKDPS